jgi:xanthosine utilization system XapX-like protein
MRVYLLSPAAGVPVGVIYGRLNVRTPAPPVAAGEPVTVTWLQKECSSRITGAAPKDQA